MHDAGFELPSTSGLKGKGNVMKSKTLSLKDQKTDVQAQKLKQLMNTNLRKKC